MNTSPEATNQIYDAFISYGRADSKAFAAQLENRLNRAGFKVWYDFNDIPLGVDYQNQIDDGITKADNFLFLISPHSVNSPYCLKEIELAIRLKKRIIPLLHVGQISQETWQQRNPGKSEAEWQTYQEKGLHSSFPNMHKTISKINWIYVQEQIDDFEKGFSGLTNILHRHQDYVRQHTILLNQALEWEKQHKQTRYLLIGEQRQKAEAWLKYRFKEEQAPCEPTLLHCELICESIKNANNLMTQVFLSYSEVNLALMIHIREILLREGITVWTNKTDIQTGEVFEAAINRGIEQADNIVYLISPEALVSHYCQQEIDYALSLKKRIIPLLIQSTDLEQIPLAIRGLQFIDFTDNQSEADLHQDLDDLLNVLQEEASYYQEHKMLLTKALKWERQHRNPIILLRGYNLHHAEDWLKVGEQRSQNRPTTLQKEFIAESLRQPPAASLDVFISYSRADSDLSRPLNSELQMRGKTTWFDQESIASGADFQQEINRGIKIADNFLFILSPRSINSPYCAAEVEYAAQLNKRFITILHQEVNTAELHPELAKVQWIDFRPGAGEFYDKINQVLRTLDTDREYVHNHTKWLQRAIEWEQESESNDLLLRGSEFAIAENWLQEAKSAKKHPPATELQIKFIQSSRHAIEAVAKQEQQRLIQLRFGLAVMTVVAGVAIIATLFAIDQSKKAKLSELKVEGKSALLLSRDGQYFEALIAAIQTGKSLKKENISDSQVTEEIPNILQKAVFDVREQNRLVKHSQGVNSVSFSPDGKTLASGSDDNSIKLWNVATGKSQTLKGHSEGVNSVSFSPDGQTLASSSWDNSIKLWNVATGKEIRTLKGDSQWVNSVSFSRDGQTLASSSLDNSIKLWNVATGKEIRTLKGDSQGVISISLSPDGQTLASSSGDNSIKLWNVATGKEIRTLKGDSQWVYSISFSPDGQTLASSSGDNSIKLWNVATGESRTLKGHSQGITSVSFSPDGQTLASGSGDKHIKLWNVATGEEKLTLEGHSDWVISVSFSPDGQTLASGSQDNSIKLWNLATSQESRTLKGHSELVNSISFSPDGQTLASSSWDNSIKLWNVATGKEKLTLTGHSEGITTSVSFSPDGQTLASSSWDNSIKLWNVATGKEKLTLKGHSEGITTSVSFSPDGQTLASGSGDKSIKLWNVATGKEKLTLKGHSEVVNSVSFSPDGQTLASGSDDKSIKLWNVATGESRTLKGHSQGITSVSFSPDGQTLASGSGDKSIKLWNVATGKEKLTLKGHSRGITSVSFSPDGQTLASGSGDKSIKLWNVATGKEKLTLKGHSQEVNRVSFSPDGKTLASGSDDKTIILWHLEFNFDRLLERGCSWLDAYLHNPNSGASERERHLCDDINIKKNGTKSP